MAEKGPTTIDRFVLYQTGHEDEASYRNAEWPSSEINEIKQRDLRLALELADIAQALDFMYPSYGGFPGKVRTVKSSRQSDPAVYTSFPADTMERLKQFLHENH